MIYSLNGQRCTSSSRLLVQSSIHDEFVERVSGMLAGTITVHHGHMPEITLTGPDGATGIWAMEDKLWPRPGSALPFRWLHGYGHYHERYVKQEDGWRIAEIRLTRLRVDLG